MKLILTRTHAGATLGVLREFGRIEPVDAQTDPALLARIVDCFNACDGLSDDTMKLMANGGTKAGNLVERTVAWSLCWSANNRRAGEWLAKARAEIAKLQEPI